jgi:SAM-dependent methyltransferase
MNFGRSAYRTFIGPGAKFDLFSAIQFNLLTALGLREHHSVLDIGCGSLRAGRLLIPYLLPGCYFGLEPECWLIEEGIAHEVTPAQIALKRPTFKHNRDFRLREFGRTFDYLIAHSVLSHTSAKQIRQCFSEAARVMTPSSVFVASFFEGPTDYQGSGMAVRAEFRFDTVAAIARSNGLSCERLAWPHPDMQQWLVIRRADSTFAVPDFDDRMRIATLEQELANCTIRLSDVEHHPYVRFGKRISHAVRLLKLHAMRISATLRKASRSLR